MLLQDSAEVGGNDCTPTPVALTLILEPITITLTVTLTLMDIATVTNLAGECTGVRFDGAEGCSRGMGYGVSSAGDTNRNRVGMQGRLL